MSVAWGSMTGKRGGWFFVAIGVIVVLILVKAFQQPSNAGK